MWISRLFYRVEIFILIFKIFGDSDYCGIICSIVEFGNKNFLIIFFCMFMKGIM